MLDRFAAATGMVKKSKMLPPRRKRMSRSARLQSGRHWLENFSGKRVVPSYARWFGVDLLCAATELRMLGVRLSPDYLEALRRTVAARPTRRGSSVGTTDGTGLDVISSHEFAFVAGYTEGGAPFGVGWDDIDSDHGLVDEHESGDPTDAPPPDDARHHGATVLDPEFTELQGQYLAFIAAYTTLHRRPPAEADIQAYSRVTPPSVHAMIVELERRGLISKVPGAPRSIRVLVSADRLPTLK